MCLVFRCRCAKANANTRPEQAELHPISVKELFHRWGIDLVGPLKQTARGNVYIITATEYLTRLEPALTGQRNSTNQYSIQLQLGLGVGLVLK